MVHLKGIPVILCKRQKMGQDGFGAPIWEETPVIVENVLVSPTAAAEMVTDLQLYGKRAEYELCIPKGDTNDWEDTFVEFFGRRWRTIGPVTELIGQNVPLCWNKKVKVARYG